MQHEGIARVFDAGTTAEGRPYLVMEYVQGTPITRFCDDAALSLRARLDLFLRVCEAVQYAHQQGVIHRDLKPGNVLVAPAGGRPQPKVIDFGLAKVLGAEHSATILTEAGQILGTPEYMSPEQAAADGPPLDTRSDVYALGVILFELLTGRLPHEASSRSSSGLLDLLRRIRDQDAPRASAAARSPHVPARALRGDLDCIVATALARDRERRYAGVSDLAADLRRHAASQPILARPPSFAYVARKLVARHRMATAVLAVAAAAGAALLVRELDNARELAGWDHRYRKLGLAQEVEALRRLAEEELLPIAPGGRHDATALTAWLVRAEELAARAADRRADLEAMNQRGRPGPGGALQFEDARDEVLHASLRSLVDALDDFERQKLPDRVRRHLDWCERVEAATLREATAAWQGALDEIADAARCPAYRGLRFEPQLGLIPLRRDPASGLWEFRLWSPAGEAPAFGADARVDNLGTADPILVLLPGGTFWCGSQKDDAAAPGYDEDGVGLERPAHRVTLAPFWIGKHELTQGQWERWTGSNPAFWGPPRRLRTEAFPVEQVSWRRSDVELRSWGLLLPTEAQWEFAARGGSAQPWWTGADPASLDGRINLADRSAKEFGVPNSWFHVELDDRQPLPARADALAANAFGLHCILGNVWEWCRDPHRNRYPADGEEGHASGDGLLAADVPGRQRPTRGGSYLSTRLFVRCANRLHRADSTEAGEQGLRVARPIVGAWTQEGETR
jgi:formylglycine-generating enzyme required for sulfatase activity